MYQSKKELRRRIDNLGNRYVTLKLDHEKLLYNYHQLLDELNDVKSQPCEKSNFCFTCQKMVSGTPGDIQSIVCENDIGCKQYKQKV